MANEDERGLSERMQAELAIKLTEAANWVMDDRAAVYDARPDKAPKADAVPAIIAECTAKNVAVAVAANWVPGPWGLLALVPELVVTLRNQLIMIHAIGYALGKKERLTPSLLLGVLAMGTAGSGVGFVVIKGQTVVVKRASLRVLQKLVGLLAGKITQKSAEAVPPQMGSNRGARRDGDLGGSHDPAHRQEGPGGVLQGDHRRGGW